MMSKARWTIYPGTLFGFHVFTTHLDRKSQDCLWEKKVQQYLPTPNHPLTTTATHKKHTRTNKTENNLETEAKTIK